MTTMAAEIAEQPQAAAATLESLLALRREIAGLAQQTRHVQFIARGSSDNAAIYGRYLLEVHAGRQAGLAAPSVATHYRSALDLSDTLVVAVSQSGRTEEIVETQSWAASCGARTIAVTNDGESPLAAQADLALVTRAGVERAVPATKTYTTQLVAMAVLATALAPDQHALDAELGRVPGEIERLVAARDGVEAAVEILAGAPGRSDEVLTSGRGLSLGTALEVALKLEETCLTPVRALSYADLRHGPIAVVDAQLDAVLVSASSGPLVEGMRDLALDLRERGVRSLVAIGGDESLAAAVDASLPGPDLVEEVAPLALVVPGQLMVEAIARRRGLDPDAPRGLRKVTQTDV